MSKTITVEGQKYESISEACRALGLSCGTVRMRLYNGWAIDEVFEIAPRKAPQNQPKQIEIDGKAFPSIQKACEEYGITYSLFKERHKRGYSIENALKKPANKKRLKTNNST